MKNRYSITIINYKCYLDKIRNEVGDQLQLSPVFCFRNNYINLHKEYWEMIYYQIGENDKDKITEIAKRHNKSYVEIDELTDTNKKGKK